MTDSNIFDVVTPTGDIAADSRLLAEIRTFLTRHEAINTIQLAGFCARDSFDPAQIVLVVRNAGGIVACASQGGPFNMLVSPVEDLGASDALVEYIVAHDLVVPGVMAESSVSLAVANRWAERTGGSYAPGMTQRILATSAITPPAEVAGSARHIDATDSPLLAEWFADFVVDIGEEPAESAADHGRGMADRIVSGLGPGHGGLIWLDDSGEPVSVACYKSRTPTGIRVGPVYTPPEHRRRGYAGAVTAAVSQVMLDRGRAFVCLYTDAANPTSNHVYESIGYEWVADSMQYRFTPQ